MQRLDLFVFGVPIRIQCADKVSHSLALANFEAFLAEPSSAPVYHFDVRRAERARGHNVTSAHRGTFHASDAYELMYYLEKSITIDVQLSRRDLFFVHGAALVHNRGACLLIAPSGRGKSTTAWAMAHSGFGYMSDELAPIDPKTRQVQPYPHAVCLKAVPPGPFPLPEGTIRTKHTLHVPSRLLPNVVTDPTPLRAVFFNSFDPSATSPAAAPLSSGEAAALVYANGLNQLAHDGHGLKAAATAVASIRCFQVTTCRDLEATCALLRSLL